MSVVALTMSLKIMAAPQSPELIPEPGTAGPLYYFDILKKSGISPESASAMSAVFVAAMEMIEREPGKKKLIEAVARIVGTQATTIAAQMEQGVTKNSMPPTCMVAEALEKGTFVSPDPRALALAKRACVIEQNRSRAEPE